MDAAKLSNCTEESSSHLTSTTANQRKRQKIAEAPSPSPPNYGSKDYWEQRYAKQFQLLGVPIDQSGDGLTLPYHSWYFTYDELRPILLPILLGGRHEARMLIEKYEDAEEGDGDTEEVEEGQEEDGVTEEGEDEERSNDDAKDGEDGDDFETVDDEDDDVDDEGDEIGAREGLARNGPISVLEIGCGDVPLGAALALELKELEETTGAKSSSVVTGITCTDYSQVVVDMMQKQYCSQHQAVIETADDGDEKDESGADVAALPYDANVGTVPLHFVVADARNLPYPDSSFSMVLEKGTLDAMLSDTDTGVADCVKIVAECARVVSACLVLISHLNAHAASGLGWLSDVVFAGLRQHPNALWDIEVHGNSDIIDSDADDARIPAGTSGPAVYVIHKRPKVAANEGSAPEKSTIPVKFFSY